MFRRGMGFADSPRRFVCWFAFGCRELFRLLLILSTGGGPDWGGGSSFGGVPIR